MEYHFALERIDDDLVARPRMLVKISQSDDRGNPQPAGDNRRVRSPTTRVRGDRSRVLKIQLSNCRRQQVFRHNHSVLRQVAVPGALPTQRYQHTLDYV